MKRRLAMGIVVLVLCVIAFYLIHTSTTSPMTKEKATKRVEGFIKAVNDNNPAEIYNYLTPEIKGLIDKEGFMENFAKERSYPYLTPLYLYLEQLDLSYDKKAGHVKCVVAARLPGEKMEFPIVFVEDNYYVEVFREIADGSFIEKFEKLTKDN